MAMPEASVHKNDLVKPWKDQIGFSWKVFSIQAEAVAHAVHETAHGHFRPGIFAFHRLHRSSSDGRRLHIRLFGLA
jgi:hypothetical protein